LLVCRDGKFYSDSHSADLLYLYSAPDRKVSHLHGF
jgi:hypothetical protein